MSSTLSVRDVCELYCVTAHTVLGWIRRGELRAINVGRRPGTKKPRWRITQDALTSFEQLRAVSPPPPRGRGKRRTEGGVIKFY